MGDLMFVIFNVLVLHSSNILVLQFTLHECRQDQIFNVLELSRNSRDLICFVKSICFK
jgi:hypothetical protein